MKRVPPTNRLRNILSFALTIALIALVIVIIWRDQLAIKNFIRQSGWLGLLVSLSVYGLLGLSPVPSEPITVLLGTIYGPVTATLVAGTGNLLAALVEYVLGRRIGGLANFEERRKQLPFNLGSLPVDSAAFLLLARMLPGYGPKFVSLVGGLYRVPLWRYIWTAAIPTYLGAAIFAFGGFGLLHLHPS